MVTDPKTAPGDSDKSAPSSAPNMFSCTKSAGTNAAYCFLSGSIMFTIDGAIYISEGGLTVQTALYTLGSFLFAVGSYLMLL